MGRAKEGLDRFLKKNQQDLIECPYQPGHLRISKSACSKRYRLSRKENSTPFGKSDLFYFSFRRGLAVCRTCPIGKKLAVA